MHILLLPGSLKGSLSALQAGRILSRHLQIKHTVQMFPIADGGDGFIDCFATLDPQAKRIKVRAKNAFLHTQNSSFLMLSDGKTAVLETARICGLGNTPFEQLDPLGASSYGVGQVLLAAIKHGAKNIYVGLGGVACNDGGAGMAVACGAQLTDKQGRSLPPGAAALLKLAKADFSALEKIMKSVSIIGVADVTNPLLGPKSSAKVFGPQKGATPSQVKLLDKALARWARVIYQTNGRKIATVPSTAAAGAIAAGLVGCFGASLLLGSDFLLHKLALNKQIQWADLILTSEGKLDAQTFYGKAPFGVLKWAQKYNKPVLFICGQADWKALRQQSLSRVCIAELIDFAPSIQEAQKHAGRYLARICRSI